jgi:hypothetical protein
MVGNTTKHSFELIDTFGNTGISMISPKQNMGQRYAEITRAMNKTAMMHNGVFRGPAKKVSCPSAQHALISSFR